MIPCSAVTICRKFKTAKAQWPELEHRHLLSLSSTFFSRKKKSGLIHNQCYSSRVWVKIWSCSRLLRDFFFSNFSRLNAYMSNESSLFVFLLCGKAAFSFSVHRFCWIFQILWSLRYMHTCVVICLVKSFLWSLRFECRIGSSLLSKISLGIPILRFCAMLLIIHLSELGIQECPACLLAVKNWNFQGFFEWVEVGILIVIRGILRDSFSVLVFECKMHVAFILLCFYASDNILQFFCCITLISCWKFPNFDRFTQFLFSICRLNCPYLWLCSSFWIRAQL